MTSLSLFLSKNTLHLIVIVWKLICKFFDSSKQSFCHGYGHKAQSHHLACQLESQLAHAQWQTYAAFHQIQLCYFLLSHLLLAQITNANTISRNKTVKPMLKIIGESTQNQLQLMKPVSLSTMNTIVKRPQKPIPLELVATLSLISHFPLLRTLRYLCHA